MLYFCDVIFVAQGKIVATYCIIQNLFFHVQFTAACAATVAVATHNQKINQNGFSYCLLLL
jgi:hypothetical protein